MFHDRTDAAKRLASLLWEYKNKGYLVLAIPRGGVIIADTVCQELGSELGLVVVKKMTAPFQEETAIGAVAEDGTAVLDEDAIDDFSIPKEYVEDEKFNVMLEIRRRVDAYMARKLQTDFSNRRVILVDDGIATGLTMQCAVGYVKSKKPSEIIVATPVAPVGIVKKLEAEVDTVVVVEMPEELYAVGNLYESFEQLSDDDIIRVVKKYTLK